jgi:hypothetical protein
MVSSSGAGVYLSAARFALFPPFLSGAFTISHGMHLLLSYKKNTENNGMDFSESNNNVNP